MWKKSMPFFVCFFLLSGTLLPQEFPFVYYTPKDGLVNNRVRKIYQDSRGRLYFLSYGGMSVFDGSRFINYTSDNGLPDELVNDILELGPDSFLVATNTNRLSFLVNGRMKDAPFPAKSQVLVNRIFRCKDGSIFLAADEGLYQLSKNGIQKIDLKGWEIPGEKPYLGFITEIENYLLLAAYDLGTKKDLVLFDRKTNKIISVVKNAGITFFDKNAEGVAWIGTLNGIWQIDREALKKGELYLVRPPPFPGIYWDQFTSIAFHDGYTWYSQGPNKLFKIGKDGSILSVPFPEKPGNIGFSGLFVDREEILWAIQEGTGVIKLGNTHLYLIENPLQGRTDQLIQFAGYQSDTTWFIAGNNFIARQEEKEINCFKTNLSGPIYNLIQYRGRLLACKDQVLSEANIPGSKNNYIRFKQLFRLDSTNTFSNKFLVSKDAVFLSSSNRVWYYNQRGIFPLFNVKKPDLIEGIEILDGDRLVYVTRSSGLSISTRAVSGKWEDVEPDIHLTDELISSSPRCMLIDKQGLIWIGTRNAGLFAYSFTGDRLVRKYHFTRKDGLSDNFITCISTDSTGQLLTGSSSGVDRLISDSVRGFRIESLTKSNNLFGFISYIWVDRKNRAYALRKTGELLVMEPNRSWKNKISPDLFIESLKVNGQPVSTFAQPLQLNFKQRNLSLQVAAPTFLDEKQVNFSYLLVSENPASWSEPSGNSDISLLNLTPGSYELKVKAYFQSTPYTPNEISFFFTIHPPWFNTWQARILTWSILAAILYILVRQYFTRKLRKEKTRMEQQKALEKERTRIATDMHDDLGAGLSRIKFLSEIIAIRKQKREPIDEEISSIRTYTHEMIDKMGEIVWALNQKNDSLSDLIAYTRSYLVEYLTQNGISCEVQLPDQFPSNFVSGEYRRNVFLSVKEALHNIVKHSHAGKVDVRISTHEDLIIEIKDDGRGMVASQPKKFSNGLGNMEQRMKEIGGSFQIKSGKGTTVILRAPILP